MTPQIDMLRPCHWESRAELQLAESVVAPGGASEILRRPRQKNAALRKRKAVATDEDSVETASRGGDPSQAYMEGTLQQKRRCRRVLERVVRNLKLLTSAQRRKFVEGALSHPQRLALRQFMERQRLKQDQAVETLAQCAQLAATQLDENPRRAAVQRLVLGQDHASNAELEPSRGLGCHVKGGHRFYFASLAIDWLVLRSKSRRCKSEALAHLRFLRAIRHHVQAGQGSFEQRVRHAVQVVLQDTAAQQPHEYSKLVSDITLTVRVAASFWVGCDLHTPAYTLAELEGLLSAWRALRLARGTPGMGGRGTLSHMTPQQATETWTRTRGAYLSICASRGRCVRQVTARLVAMEALRAAKVEKWRQQREVAALSQLDMLVARWPGRHTAPCAASPAGATRAHASRRGRLRTERPAGLTRPRCVAPSRSIAGSSFRGVHPAGEEIMQG